MKKNILLSLCLVFSVVATIMVFNACQKPTVGLELPRAIGPVSIQIMDANPAAESNPANPTVQITGENALEVVNLITKLDFTPQNGLITLGLKKNATPSESKPYRFNVVVSAEGYLTTVVPIVITEDKLQVVSVRMVNLKTPPTSALVSTANFAAGDAGAVQTKDVKVNVPAGVTLTDANGATLSGSIASTLVSFDVDKQETQLAFPGGFVQQKIINTKGESVEGGVITPYAFISLDMTAGGNSVKKFSKPVEVSMAIAKGAKNPTTELDIKEGDELGLYSMDKGASAWSEEGTVKVVSDGNGGLKAVATISHLSFWSIAIISPFCIAGATVNLSGFERNSTFYCILTYAATNQVYNANAIPVNTNASGAGSLRLSFMPKGVKLKAFFFPSPIWNYGGVQLPPLASYTTPFDACTGVANVTCTNCATTTGSVCFDIKIKCNNNATNLETNIDAPVWYRRYNTANPNGTWSYLGYVLNGKLCTNALTVGNRYDFVTFYGPAWTGYTVKSAAITEVREFCP